ncbi:hypothetical protein [Microbacterium sp. F2]|uniref:hypothetical protein n=1 Tax=Microbacterium sp. F2 TaxID=3422228 RepID=UPI003FD0E8B6
MAARLGVVHGAGEGGLDAENHALVRCCASGAEIAGLPDARITVRVPVPRVHGGASIAVPVFQREGGIGAALGLVAAAEDAGMLERHLPALRGIARRIEASVGAFPLATMRPARASAQVTSAQRNGGSNQRGLGH